MNEQPIPTDIETVWRVAADGIPIDTHDNYYESLNEAFEAAAEYTKLTNITYTIQEITTVMTEYDIP